MFEKIRFWLVIVVAMLLLIYVLPIQNIASYVAFSIYPKSDMIITLSLANPEVTTLSAERSNKLILRAEVKDSSGIPVQNVYVNFSVGNKRGSIYSSNPRTDQQGECLATYIPDDYLPEQLAKDSNVTLTASINKYGEESSVKIALVRPPIVFIHGYLENVNIFDNIKDYLDHKNFDSDILDYKSENGVLSGSKELDNFLRAQKFRLLSKGIQVQKFDLITHSMGGLVARYYTSAPDYIRDSDVRKLIFVSVPQKGSPWASLGANYFNDQGIRDLDPYSDLLQKTFPNMANKGLNQTIQIGSILGQFDEVVSPESASLDEWNIKTEVFNIGENNFTVDNLFNGNIMEAANHKNVLNNKRVFEKVEDMLTRDLAYPAVRK